MTDPNTMTIEQVNAAIAEFDERCVRDDDGEWSVNNRRFMFPPRYASDIALLWPVWMQIQRSHTWEVYAPIPRGDRFLAVAIHDAGADFDGRASTALEALARAVAWVAMQEVDA
jgi:hypothetical protein